MKRNAIAQAVATIVSGDTPAADESKKIVGAHAKRMQAEAQQDALKLASAHDQRNKADKTTREVMLERAKEYAKPGFGYDKQTGLHVLHTTYLDYLQQAMQKQRGETGTVSGYVRRYKSDFAAVLSAAHVGQELRAYRYPTKLDENKKPIAWNITADRSSIKLPKDATWKMVEEVKTSAIALLKELPGNVRDMVTEARRIRKAKGIKGKKASTAAEGARALTETTFDNMLERMESRLTPRQCIRLVAFACQETLERVHPGNKAFYERAAAEFVSVTKRAMMDSEKQRDEALLQQLGLRQPDARSVKRQRVAEVQAAPAETTKRKRKAA